VPVTVTGRDFDCRQCRGATLLDGLAAPVTGVWLIGSRSATRLAPAVTVANPRQDRSWTPMIPSRRIPPILSSSPCPHRAHARSRPARVVRHGPGRRRSGRFVQLRTRKEPETRIVPSIPGQHLACYNSRLAARRWSAPGPVPVTGRDLDCRQCRGATLLDGLAAPVTGVWLMIRVAQRRDGSGIPVRNPSCYRDCASLSDGPSHGPGRTRNTIVTVRNELRIQA
jgi:hypothetical protein